MLFCKILLFSFEVIFYLEWSYLPPVFSLYGLFSPSLMLEKEGCFWFSPTMRFRRLGEVEPKLSPVSKYKMSFFRISRDMLLLTAEEKIWWLAVLTR